VNAPLAVAMLLALACEHAAGADAAAHDSDKARITGTVVDSDGKPVAGAEVRRSKGDDPPVHADAEGRFTMQLASASVRYTMLLASHEHDALMGLWETRDTGSKVLDASVDVKLVLKSSRTVKAKVVNALGKPVPEAKVTARHAYDYIALGDTDAHGEATLRVPEDAKVTEIMAMKPGVGFDYYENKASRKWLDVKPLPAEVTLTLDGVSHFQVRTVDSKGKPVPGVSFCPWYFTKLGKNDEVNLGAPPSRFPLLQTTDASGLATFDVLPAQLKGPVPIRCHAAEWQQPVDDTWPPRGGVGAGPPIIEVKLLHNAKANGIVLHADGKPAAGILMQAEGRGNTNHYCRTITRTGADGTFAFTLYPEQSYIIAITEKEWSAPSTTGFIMREGEDRDDLFFTLGKGTLVSGTVTHITSGAPLGGKTITVIQKGASIDVKAFGVGVFGEREESLVRWTETDAQGRYAIRLGSGRFQVSADYADEDRGEIFVGDQPEMQRDFKITPRE
jgi:hypothetical protein